MSSVRGDLKSKCLGAPAGTCRSVAVSSGVAARCRSRAGGRTPLADNDNTRQRATSRNGDQRRPVLANAVGRRMPRLLGEQSTPPRPSTVHEFSALVASSPAAKRRLRLVAGPAGRPRPGAPLSPHGQSTPRPDRVGRSAHGRRHPSTSSEEAQQDLASVHLCCCFERQLPVTVAGAPTSCSLSTRDGLHLRRHRDSASCSLFLALALASPSLGLGFALALVLLLCPAGLSGEGRWFCGLPVLGGTGTRCAAWCGRGLPRGGTGPQPDPSRGPAGGRWSSAGR